MQASDSKAPSLATMIHTEVGCWFEPCGAKDSSPSRLGRQGGPLAGQQRILWRQSRSQSEQTGVTHGLTLVGTGSVDPGSNRSTGQPPGGAPGLCCDARLQAPGIGSISPRTMVC